MGRIDKLPAGGVHVIGDRGHVWATPAGKDGVIAIYSGHAPTEFFDPVKNLVEAALQRTGTLTLIVDGERFQTYDAPFREKWTQWFIQNRKRLTEMHFLARTAMVRMGIALVSLAVSGLVRTYRDRAAFERALGPNLPDYQRLNALTLSAAV